MREDRCRLLLPGSLGIPRRGNYGPRDWRLRRLRNGEKTTIVTSKTHRLLLLHLLLQTIDRGKSGLQGFATDILDQ